MTLAGSTSTLEGAHWLAQSWAESLALAFESLAGERVRVDCQPEPGPHATAGDDLCWGQSFSLFHEPSAWAHLPEPAWRALGTRALSAAGVEEAPDSEVRATCREMLSQAFSGTASALSQRAGKEVSCSTGKEGAGIPGDATRWQVLVSVGSEPLPTLSLVLGRSLLETVSAWAGSQPRQDVQPPEPASQTSSKTLDVLLDVELPVRVSFGRAMMPLQDVLKLTAGSVVELDRSIGDPVELIVNNCVVALGEVVVVEGNYGVKIENIASREKRLKTSRQSPDLS